MAFSKSDYQMIFRENGIECKLCACCYSMKPLTEFGLDNRAPSGRQAKCRYCANKTHKRTKEQIRGHNLKRNYGIEYKTYQNLYDIQNGKCLICKEWKEILFIDHDHNTNEIRGLLCGNCNIGIGNLQDNPYNTEMATRYLQEFQHD